MYIEYFLKYLFVFSVKPNLNWLMAFCNMIKSQDAFGIFNLEIDKLAS